MLLSKIQKFFQKTPGTSENITDISDAISWIKTYRKALNFDLAIMATKELILKNQTSITYYENTQRKIAVLENSNIEQIATRAKEKRQKIDKVIISLYKDLRSLEKILGEIEVEKEKKM